ncbi:MAG: cytochrome c3 family protein [Verrucomicrobiales bacterium]
MPNVFPRSWNFVPLKAVFCVGVLGGYLTLGYWYYFDQDYTRVGYMPDQPVAFDHALHSGQLGMDCRYCHNFVEVSGHSNVPSTKTCMSCHSLVGVENPKLEPVRRSWDTGEPIKWVRIHQAPDYVYFNHAVHVARGVSCVSCHGQVNEMEVVWHHESQSMGWCLDCHREPEKHLRPLDEVYNMTYEVSREEQLRVGLELKERWAVNPPENCAGCHR